jgi:hypothetical protein
MKEHHEPDEDRRGREQTEEQTEACERTFGGNGATHQHCILLVEWTTTAQLFSSVGFGVRRDEPP